VGVTVIAEVVEFCEKKSLYLIMDDIYHRLIFDGRKPINCYEFAKDLSEGSKLVLVNGVSKQYAMTGFRIGWAVANKKLIDVMTNIQSHQTSGPSALLQHAAVAAINGVQSSVESLRLTLENNRSLFFERGSASMNAELFLLALRNSSRTMTGRSRRVFSSILPERLGRR
jgi:aspartate aminotransferase